VSIFASPPPAIPKYPADLVQGSWWGFYYGIEDKDAEGPYHRIVEIAGHTGKKPDESVPVIPGTLQEYELAPDGEQTYRWRQMEERHWNGEGYDKKDYPIEPWVLQEIELEKWVEAAHRDNAHPVLARLQSIHDYASKKSIFLCDGQIVMWFMAKTYDREHMMQFCRYASRAVRFAKRQGVKVRVQPYVSTFA